MTSLDLDDIIFEEDLHRYRLRGRDYPSVTTIIRLAGFGADFSKIPEAILEFARGRGDAVHLACHYLDECGLNWDALDPRIVGYVKAYARSLEECPGKIIANEKKMVSVELNLAGRPDRIRFVRGKRSVVDLKSGQAGGVESGLQTAGYTLLWNSLHPKERIADRYGLRLWPNGRYQLIPHKDPQNFQTFTDAMRFVHELEINKKWKVYYGIPSINGSRS